MLRAAHSRTHDNGHLLMMWTLTDKHVRLLNVAADPLERIAVRLVHDLAIDTYAASHGACRLAL